MSSEDQQSGLWLWHGAEPPQSEEPPETTAPPPPLRVERIAYRLGFVTRRVKWLAPPGAMALIALAALAAAHLLPGGEPTAPNTAAAQSQPARSPSAAPTADPVLHLAELEQVEMPAPELPAMLFGGLATPPVSIFQPVARDAEHKTVISHPAHRSRHFARRAHGFVAHRGTPMFWQACRYRCGWAEPVTWHGGGY